MKRSEAINIIREVVREAIELDNTMTVLSVIDGKRNLDNEQIRQLFDDMPGTFYIHRHEEGEQSDKRKVSKQEAYKYVDYYNARLKGDSKKEEKLGAELKVLGFESELLFRIGEFNTDPSVFSVNEGPGKDYLDKVARDYFMEKDFDSADPKPNPNDVAAYIGETETDEISELELPDFLEEGNYDEVKVAEYQFEENKYDFGKMAGAGEYDSSIIIYKVVDKMGKQVLIPGEKGKKYPFLAASDRGPLGDTYPLLDEKHVKILKSIADIFEPREPDYDSDDYFRTQKGKGMNLENFKDGKAAPYGSGYKKVTKEDIRNLVVGLIHEMKNLNYNNFIQMVRDDMMAGAAPDEYPSDERVRKYAKALYSRYLKGASLDDLFETKDTIEEKDDRCTRIAKRKYDTWPSAYASGAVVRCRRGEIWKKK